MKCVFYSALVFSLSLSVLAGSRGDGPGNKNAQSRATFSFETGSELTTNKFVNGSYLLPAEEPNEVCIEQLRDINIYDGMRRRENIAVKDTSIKDIRIAQRELDRFDKEYFWVTSLRQLPAGQFGEANVLRKSCNVIGLAKDAHTSKKYLQHHYVNISTNVPVDGNIKFAPIITAHSGAPFATILSGLTLGLSEVMGQTAQAVADQLENAINNRIKKSNEEKMAAYNAIALDLMLMMCEVQAVRLQDMACDGSDIRADKYIRQLSHRYNSFVNVK